MRARLAVGVLWVAAACGIKAPPRPPLLEIAPEPVSSVGGPAGAPESPVRCGSGPSAGDAAPSEALGSVASGGYVPSVAGSADSVLPRDVARGTDAGCAGTATP